LSQINASFDEGRRGGTEQIKTAMPQQHFTVCNSCGTGDRAHFNSIRHNLIGSAGKGSTAFDRQSVALYARNPYAHSGKASRQIGNLRLSGSISDDVVPVANTAASSKFSVAPTEGCGRINSAPLNPPGAAAWIMPPSRFIDAPIARRPST
jgi:hypothetical protein